MLILEVNIAPYQPMSGDDIEGESALDLRYYYFLSDLIFQIGGVDFSARWGWIPAIDFAVGINMLLQTLQGGEERTFEFTESEALITMRRTGDLIETTTSYTPGRALIDKAEFDDAAQQLVLRLHERITTSNPGLLRNRDYIAMLQEVGVL